MQLKVSGTVIGLLLVVLRRCLAGIVLGLLRLRDACTCVFGVTLPPLTRALKATILSTAQSPDAASVWTAHATHCAELDRLRMLA